MDLEQGRAPAAATGAPWARRVQSNYETVRVCCGPEAAGELVHVRLCGLVEGDEQGAALRGQVRRARLDEAGGMTYAFRPAHRIVVRWRDRVVGLRMWFGGHRADQLERSLASARFCPCWKCWERSGPQERKRAEEAKNRYTPRPVDPNNPKARLFRRALGRPEFVVVAKKARVERPIEMID